ncbi:MAG TPA: DNA-binding protein [Polyangiaceae bacterium]|nr:DNA-binding protein [Polyangiaceae bacterium]
MTSEPDAVMTIDELADYLKIAKSTLYKLAQQGRIPAQKVGRHWRFRKVAIDRWLEDSSPRGGETNSR